MWICTRNGCRSFMSKASMERHVASGACMKREVKGTYRACHICGKSFKSCSKVLRHILNVHKEEEEEEPKKKKTKDSPGNLNNALSEPFLQPSLIKRVFSALNVLRLFLQMLPFMSFLYLSTSHLIWFACFVIHTKYSLRCPQDKCK